MNINIDLNELFFVIGEHTRQIVSSGELTAISRGLVASLAVVFIIIKGVQLYFKDGDPRELIYLALIRIGWAVFLLESYNALFYSALWDGFTGEIAPIFGSIQLLNVIYKILLAILATMNVGSILTGGAIHLVAIPIFIIILLAYAGLLLGGINAVLTASVYLVSGKLFICLVLFDETQGWFFGWLKGFIGALLGIAIWYFVMGALINFDYWYLIEGQFMNITDLAQAVGQMINVCILVVGAAFVSVQASSLGKSILG